MSLRVYTCNHSAKKIEEIQKLVISLTVGMKAPSELDVFTTKYW